MRRHAKAPSAGSTSGTGSSRVLIGRALATRGASGDTGGSGASSGRLLIGVFSALALLLALALTPSGAAAAETHLRLGFSPITGSGSGVTIEAPSGLAVDEASGNVFLNDGGANNVVDIFGDEGGAPVGLAPPFQIAGFAFNGEPSGAAIDNSATSPSKGTLYVTDVVNQRLKKFTRNAGTEAYEAAGELSTSSGPALGEVLGVAVDADGNVFVADYGSSSVIEFSPAGVQLARINTSAGVGTPSAVAVDSAGDLFVQGYSSSDVVKYPVNGSGEIESAVFTPVASGSTGIAVDAGANRLYVALGDRVSQYSAATLAFQGSFGADLPLHTARVAVNSATGRIYVSDAAAANIVVFGPPVILPGATVGGATNLTPTKATLSGSVNPDNLAVTDCAFEYLTEAEYEENGNSYAGVNAPLTQACEGTIPTDSSDHPVTVALTGLSGGTTYHFRLSASNVNGTNHSDDETFSSSEAAVTRDATDNSGTKATLNGAVFPDNVAVTECKFEYGTTTAYGSSIPCEETVPADEDEHPVTAGLTNLQPNGTTYHFRLVVVNGSGTVNGADRSFTTPDTVVTGAASDIVAQAATVNGTVKTDGVPLTECKFEYGPTASYGASADCVPPFGSIPNDSAFHPVSADLGGLDVNSTYHFRLVAANANGPISGGDESFTTSGPPQIVEEVATNVEKTTATLQAKINPSGFATTYYFEWGTDDSYGNRVPLTEDPAIGSGSAPVLVTADISGLQEATEYHFHVIAVNSAGTIPGPDREFATLNAAGLPDNRRFELVSPPEKKPQGAVTFELGNFFVISQVAEDGQAVAFPLLGGLAGTDAGGDSSFRAQRSSTGWSSHKISPPSLVPAPTGGLLGNATPGLVVYNSPSLSCSLVNTFNPLTDDTPAADVELGLYNLYSRSSGGTYRLITNTVPGNPGINPLGSGFPASAIVAGASPDCSRVYFLSEYDYLPNASGLYEWNDGTLHDAGRLPNGAVPVHPIAPPGVTGEITVALGGEYGLQAGSRANSVSRDGSRFFFTAASNEPETSDTPAVFVREDGNTVEVSRKAPGGTASSLGAHYETASPDGSHVFFTATYGLTANSSNGPADSCSNVELRDVELGKAKACDLYDYDVDTGELKNLSADTNVADTNGAMVDGVVAVSHDGSSVYFSARGQLVPGAGKTYAENVADASSQHGSSNLYLARDGELLYVATVGESDLNSNGANVLIRASGGTSETTPDGDYLVFASDANVTGYDSGGANEAYRYSAATHKTECISCRLDGLPSMGYDPRFLGGQSPLLPSFPSAPTRQSQPRKMSDDGSRVFFTMPDVLAPGAVGGINNIYEWENGQISFLASGIPKPFIGADFESTELYGISNSGDDVFIHSPARLDAHDTDSVQDIYDIRVDGGFAPPPPPPTPCDPAADQCQGTPEPPPAVSSATSAGFSGPGNPPAPELKKCGKGKVFKHGKCRKKPHKKAKHHKHSKQRRTANTNHGGAK